MERKGSRRTPALLGATCWLFLACGPTSNAQHKQAHLVVGSTIRLPGVTGRMDHLAMAEHHNLVFIAATRKNSVEVVDLVTGKHIASITGIKEPQGVVFLPEDRSILVSSGRTGACNFYNVDDRKLKRYIQLDADADNIRYVPSLGRILIGHGNGGIAVVDAHTFEVIVDIPLGGHPESFQVDVQRDRLFVNLPDEHEVCMIDLSTWVILARWKLGFAQANYPMALDTAGQLIFVGCRSPARVLVMNYEGAIVQTLAGPGDMDDLFYDPAEATLTAIGGEGAVTLYERSVKGAFVQRSSLPTRKGARTGSLLGARHELLVAAPEEHGDPAALMFFAIEHR